MTAAAGAVYVRVGSRRFRLRPAMLALYALGTLSVLLAARWAVVSLLYSVPSQGGMEKKPPILKPGGHAQHQHQQQQQQQQQQEPEYRQPKQQHLKQPPPPLEPEDYLPQELPPSKLKDLGTYFTRNATDWVRLTCDTSRQFRSVSLDVELGRLQLYVYDSEDDDPTATRRLLRGEIFERNDIESFLELSAGLPLIDVGANLGLVTLQAAMQGRQVVAVEPVPENALRLCRSALDFGHASRVHVLLNAASSREGEVHLISGSRPQSTLYRIAGQGKGGEGSVQAYAIPLDHLLEIIPFKRVVLKIDVESHEAQVMFGCRRLFEEVDVVMVWMEWEQVRMRREHMARYILTFMRRHGMRPLHVSSLRPLDEAEFKTWPFTVLWRKEYD